MTDVDEILEPGDAPAPRGRRSPRWFPLVVADITLLIVGWILITAWSPIRASHPAFLITLVVLLAGSAGLTLWAILTTAPQRSTAFRWITRASLVIGAFALWTVLAFLRPMAADQVAVDALAGGNGVTVTISRSAISLQPDTGARSTGLVFYPGALVDPRAYARILRPIAEAGFPVRIVKFPYNLAVLGGSSADRWIGDTDDDVTTWVVGGHSLGGAMAARYADEDRDELAGLLLWAAYPVDSLADRTTLQVVSVTGTADAIIDPERVERAPSELPPDANFVPVEGAIHSFFGDYGFQNGDGTPTVSRDDAQALIVEASLDLLIAVDR
jgi:hypothetical protein